MKIIIPRILLIIFLLIIFVSISAYSYVSAVSNNISDSVFRLHVIANSNSKEDQNLKLEIRDNLLKYMNSLLLNTSSKEDAINIAENNIEEFYKIAENTISKYGYNYPINISVEKSNFPTKIYGDVTLPAGTYDALKVKIGSASGKNWWCVMFPPLCFVDISSGIVSEDSKKMLEEELSS